MITVLDGMSQLSVERAVYDSSQLLLAAGADRQNLGLHFLKVAARRGEHTAFVMGSREYCYTSLANAAVQVSRFLAAQPSFSPGDRVVLLANNSPEYVAGFYGTLLSAGVVVPLPADIDPARLADMREACDATLVLTNTQTANRRKDISPELIQNRIDLAAEEGCPPNQFPREFPQDDELALLLYTSGSTGKPKGVMLSHRNVLTNARSILDYLPIQQEDRALALLPFCHALGNSVLQTHILAGATLVVDGSPMFPNTIVDALEQHRITSFTGVPELYNSLLTCSELGDRPLTDLRYMTVAGGSLSGEDALQVAQRIEPARFITMYGQTEATARLAFLPAEDLPQRSASIGKAIPGVQLQVQDASGQELPPGEIGELCAQGDNVMQGYWNDQHATSLVFTDGWLRTGDLACVDQDGFFYLKGRRSNEIKIRGIRVDVDAVSSELLASLPDCQIVVVPFHLNHTMRLGLFLKENGIPDKTLALIRRICQEKLARHEVPSHIEIVERFPLTAALKVDLPALSQRAEDRCAQSPISVLALCTAVTSGLTQEQA